MKVAQVGHRRLHVQVASSEQLLIASFQQPKAQPPVDTVSPIEALEEIHEKQDAFRNELTAVKDLVHPSYKDEPTAAKDLAQPSYTDEPTAVKDLAQPSYTDEPTAVKDLGQQLGQVLERTDSMVPANELSPKTFTMESKSGVIDDVNKTTEEFEREVNELLKCVEQMRTSMTMRDTTLELRDQLSVQKALLEDVLQNKERAERLLAQNPEMSQREILHDLKAASIEYTLTPAGHLMSEITLLETSARDQWESLQLAVNQQSVYEAQIRSLSLAIGEAQQKLEASPNTATSVGALKQQMADRNNLTEQIKQYQLKVSEITEKNHQLALDSAQLSPSVFRKHYHPESAYMDYFAAMAQHKRGGSPYPVYGNLFYDSLPGDDFLSSTNQDSTSASIRDPKDNPLSWIPFEHLSVPSGLTPISLELPRKIPEPRTDSIPRPTWSGDIISASGLSSDCSRNTSTSHSLDSLRTSAEIYETAAARQRSLGVGYASATQLGEPFTSTATAEAGPHISRRTDATFNGSASWDSGLGTDRSEQSPNIFQSHPDSPSSIGSIAERLSSAFDQSKRVPAGGRPTEIVRMRDNVDQDGPTSATETNSFHQDEAMPASFRRPSHSRDDSSGIDPGQSIDYMSEMSESRDLVALEDRLVSDKEARLLDRDRAMVTSGDLLQDQTPTLQSETQDIPLLHDYHSKIDDLMGRIERANVWLAAHTTSESSSLEEIVKSQKEYKKILAEIESVKDELEQVKVMGEHLQDTGPGCHVTEDERLSVLVSKCNSLEMVAGDKGTQLEDVIQKKEKQVIAVEAYKKQIEDLQTWLEETKAQQALMALSTDDPSKLQAHLGTNQDIEEQIKERLRQVSELVLGCDSLSLTEDLISSEKLRKDLTELQSGLKQFNVATADTQVQLQAAITEITECSRLDNEEVNFLEQINVQQKELVKDIREHRQLVSQIADQGKHFTSTSADVITSDKEIKNSWERLNNNLAQRKANLETSLRTRSPKELVKISLHAPARFKDSCRQLEEVKKELDGFSEMLNQLQLQEQRLQSEESAPFHSQYQSVLENVSSWLDIAEQQLFTHPLTTEEQVKQNENLKKQIQSLQGQVATMNERADHLLAATHSAHRDVVSRCNSTMTGRVELLENTAQSQTEILQKADRQWKQYEDGVGKLQTELHDIQELMLAPSPAASLDQLTSNNKKIESQLKKCEAHLTELKSEEASLTYGYPKGVFMSSLVTLQSKYMELHRKAVEMQSSHQSLAIVHDQYQKMLKDCAAFLETAQGRLQVESISARGLNDLKQQLATHKEFFSDLEVHKAMLDSLASHCDGATRAHFLPQHSALVSQIHALVDQASLHGQRLERLTRQWAELVDKHTNTHRVLTSLEAQMPQPIVNGDSLTTIQDKLNKYKWLQLELADKKDTVFDVVEKGKQILHSINCTALETAITDTANMWVSMNADLTSEFKRTQTLGDQLSMFETEVATLSAWLITAKMKLANFKHLSYSSLTSIGAVRTEVDKILEFHKTVEDQATLKNRVIAVGNQLMQNKNYDTRGLAARLRDYEEEWTQLEKGIVETQEYLHQVQMELMPSRQTLSELIAWTEQISKSLEKDSSSLTKDGADIQSLVRKYRGYKIELASRQMSLDFVNQQVLVPQPGELDVSKEKREFADKLAALNKQWNTVVKEVNDNLSIFEGVKGKWGEYEESVQSLQAWFHKLEDRIDHYKLIGSEVGVKHTLEDCKALQQQLQEKQADLSSVKTLGNHLYGLSQESPNTQRLIMKSLSTLDGDQRRLDEKARQLHTLLTDMSCYWAKYHSHLTDLNELITQSEYALKHCTVVRGDIETLRTQVLKLRNLHADLKKNSGHFESFSSLASQLRQACEPAVQAEIQKTVSGLQVKWRQLSTDLAVRCGELEQHLDVWQRFENQYSTAHDWLDARRALCADLTNINTDLQKRPESLEKCKQLQRELDSFQPQLSDLYRTRDILIKNMDQSSISIMKSRCAVIEQMVLSLRQTLSRFSGTLTNDISMLHKFNEAFQVVKKFLTYSEEILLLEDPTKAAEEKAIQSRLAGLKNMLALFSTNYEKLDTLNDLGYRLALDDRDTTRLIELNHQWYRLYEDAKDRSRTLQDILIQQQDFTSKCDSWIKFLVQAEHNLSEKIMEDHSGLSQQLCKCEQFESEMDSRQQVLHSIINDSQKMMMAGEVEDKEEFQRKLHLLSEQWQNVSRRASQRKASIKDTISQWQQFKTLSQQLKQWLKDKKDALGSFDLGSNSLMVIRDLVGKVEAIKEESKLEETTLKKVHEVGNTLLQNADDSSAQKIKGMLSDINADWYKLLKALDESRSQLEGADHQWLECESDIDDMMGKLNNIRTSLNADIPSTYGALETDMKKCKDIEKDFVNSEARQRHLAEKEKQLSGMTPTNDLNLLHQRVQLLNKQREELHSQTHIREERITDALFRWTNFAANLQCLMDWIEDMTINVVSNQELHVEELLAKLENEYRQELGEKELQKAGIVEQGMQLMNVSSGGRASEIQHKINRLEEKWQHLTGVIDYRQRKLKETVLAMKQLDTSMRNLSLWLSAVEIELSDGITFKDSSLREIQAKLQNSQELQQDIERHSAGVLAVINLCEVLLHDSDACPTEAEFVTLQHAMEILEKRWRNICAVSPYRQTRVEETWQLWDSYQDDCKKFSDWMTLTEHDVEGSEVEVPNVQTAKASIKKYENLQRNVHDHLSDLEHINHQYCQLAKEGCTDTDGSRKVMLTELNNRWDALQLRVTEIMKKLRHSSSIREDFEATHASLIAWLKEVEAQVAALQHPTRMDLGTKVIEIRRIEDEIHTKRYRMKYLDQAGVYLMQKGDSQEALRVQRELDEFRKFCKRILAQVITTQLQIEHMVVAKAENTSTTNYDSEDRHHQLTATSNTQWQNVQTTCQTEQQIAQLEQYLRESPPESPAALPKPNSCRSQRSLPPVKVVPSLTCKAGSQGPKSKSPSHLRSRSPTQKSVKTTRSTSPQKRFLTSQKSPTRLARDVMGGEGQQRHDIASLERLAKIDVLMEQLVESLNDCDIKLARLDQALGPLGDSEKNMQSFVECEVLVDEVQRLDLLLKTETGLTAIESVDSQVKLVLRRWQKLQRRVQERNVRLCQDSHDFVQFTNDIENMLAWLSAAEALQSAHQRLPSDVGQLEMVIRNYKDFLNQVESKKPIMLAINLLKGKYQRTKSARNKQLERRLHDMNRRWELCLSWSEGIQRDLLVSLDQCEDLLHTIDDYHLWLESIETKVRHCEPVNLSADKAALWQKHSQLMEIHTEIKHNQAKVLSLKETADRLLISTESPQMSTARDKIYIVHKRMQSLVHLTLAYIDSLENKLQMAAKKEIAVRSKVDSSDVRQGKSSGLRSSRRSSSSTIKQPALLSTRARSRSPFAAHRCLKYQA